MRAERVESSGPLPLVLHSSIAAVLVQDYRQRALDSCNSPGSGRLTPSEHKVIELLVEGAQTKEIAQRLGVSARTVARCRASFLGKLDLHNRAELVRYALDQHSPKTA